MIQSQTNNNLVHKSSPVEHRKVYLNGHITQKGVPAHIRLVATRWSLKSLSTQSILWFCDDSENCWLCVTFTSIQQRSCECHNTKIAITLDCKQFTKRKKSVRRSCTKPSFFPYSFSWIISLLFIFIHFSEGC